MNNRTVRDFTGSRPSLAGLNPDFHPHEHQLAAAARMAHERCLVLAHEVGAGKTATMAIGMMAMRNTGQIDKPLVAVPNYLVEQWEKEVRRLFPAARILTLTSADLADGKRDRVLQYVRANSFDMVIMSHSLFDSLPLSPEFYEFYNSEELRRLEAQIHHERRRTGKSISLKKLEERRQQYEEELKAKAGVARIRGQVYLDDLGFDFFAIDEAHEYKNLAVRSKIPGARISGSARAQHLHAALEWARQNKPKGPIGCLATGTPLSNAIGELHSLIRLADPELLSALGIEEFDAFATMYGRMVERTEMTVDGKSFRSVERFASFHNVNSLLRQLWLPVVDYKDADDLGLPRPRIKGGEPELMLVPATDDQIRRMEDLGERYKAVHSGGVDKTEDNPLAINNDARVIALDPRLIDPEAEPGNKLRLLADRVAAKYHETKNNRYTYSTEDLRPHPVPGALQMVFLNHGTPSGNNRGGFNAYQEFKDLLVERGVPAEKIDFIHDAERADQRQKLALRANHGGCNVLIGSTQRMGKGLNAQNRLVALYHVDPDFRPADMKQKDGRALRQGNQHEEVEIVWVATERTFDSRMYGILATKASGFDQVYKARLADGSDEIQEVDDALVPFDEAMAIISGNPYLIAQEELRKRLRTLTLDQKNRATQRAIIFQKVQQIDKDIDGLARDIAQRGAVLPSLQPVLGKDFQITLKGVTYTKHKDAAAPLVQALADVAQALPEGRATTPNLTLGQLGGLDLVAAAYRDDQDVPHVRVSLNGLPGSLQRFTVAELGDLRGETLLRRLTKVISEAPDRQIEDEGNLAAKRATRHKLLAHSEQLRGQVPGLARVRERLRLVDALVSAQIEVNNAGEPEKGEPPAVTEQRKQAIARRDELQRQLDRFDATAPKEESSPETGEAPLNLDGDPKPLSSQQESEAAPPRAHAAGHGDPDGAVTDHLTALESPESPDAPAKEPDSSAAAHPATAAAPPAGHPGLTEEADETAGAAEPDTDRQTAPAPEPAGPQGTLQELADGFGGRVLFGHIGGPPPKPESFGGTGRQPTKQPDAQVGTPAKTAAVPEPPSAPEPADATAKEPVEQASAADGDEYGTADLYEEFGLPQPERVPATAPQDEPEPEPGADAAADVPDGQMTVEDMQPEAAPAGAAGQDAAATQEATKDDGRERLTSANGRLTFTLLRVRDDANPEVIQGWQRTRAELAAAVEAHNKQMGQSPQERAEQLGRWRRSYKGGNRLEPFRPLPSLRLTRRPDAPGFTPKEYGIGSWVTWRDEESGQQVTGQVMSPGPASNTWYVSTDRTGHTGEYHVLVRSGKKATGYTYSIHGETGSTQDVRPADGPGEQLPLEDLPKADSIPARPVTSYADYVPKGGLAAVREPLPVTVGEMGPRFDPVEVAFDVTVDGIPFVVEVNQDDETLASLFVPRIEADGKVILRLDPVESRGAAIDACVRTARQAREFADKRLYGHYRLYDLDLSEDGVCEKCSRNYGENDVQQLYRLNGSDPLCLDHLAREYGVKHSEAAEVAAAKRIMAVRVPPKAQPDPEPAIEQPAAGQKSTEQEAVAASASAEPTEPHDITRDAIRPGDLITVTVNGRDVEWDTSWGPAPETLTITGTVFPGYRDYQHSATLLDAVIHDQDGNEMTAGNDVLVRRLPAQARVTPKEHRDDLRPEPRSVAQIRLGDLIAEGGARGETVTELRFASNAQGGVVITFFTRDVASGTPNSFTLALADELLVVPRERRLPQDVAEVFGRHSGHRQAAAEARRTYELHAAVTEVALRVWPDSTGPQEELRALDSAIGAINVSGKGVDAYLANAAAMEAAETAAAALFNAVDDDLLNRYLGLPLHRLRQHLDVQAHRLRADAAHLAQHADAAASADTALAASGRPGGQEQPAPEDQPTGRIQEGENVAPNTTGPADPQTEQLGLFGDLDPGAESSQEGPGRRPLPDGMRWAHQNDVRPGDVVRFDRDGVLQDAVLIRGTAPPHYLEYDTIDRGGLLGRWDSQDEYVVVVDRGPDRTAFNRYIRRFGDYMRNDLAEALARWEQRRNATGQQPGAGQPAPDAPEAVTDDAARDQLAVTEVTGAAGIQYRLYGSMEAGNVRFYIVRQSRGVTGTVDFSGTRDECLAYIESEAAVRSAAEAVDEDSEQQAAALAWLRDRQAGAPQQPEQNARTSGAAEEPTVPELDVVLLDVDVPPLDPAEPYATDAEAQADIDRLGEAFALWAALPAVQRYYEVDRQQRPDGDGDPTNPIVQLAEAYQDAERALREGPAGSPDDLVRQVHTVAVWSDALETAVSDDLRGPLRQVREAAQLLAARSRATVESFKADTQTTASTEAGAPTGDEPAAPKDGLQDVQEPAAAAVDTPLTEQPDGPDEQLPQADGDQQAPEPDPAPAPAGVDSTSDETAQDASEEPMTTPPIPETTGVPDEPVVIEEPPEPQRYVETVPLAWDPTYSVRLSGLDDRPADSGEVLQGDLVIATLHPGPEGGWFARLAAEGLPADVTYLADSPQDAAASAAVMYSVFTGTPAGPSPGAAPGDGSQQRVDALRAALRDTAVQHREAVAAAAARADAEARREASEPRSHEVPGSGSTEVPDSGGAEVPDSQSAEPAQEAPAAPAGAAGAPDGAGAPADTVASGSDGPAPDTAVNGFRQGLEDTFQALQPETDTQSPGELPLWTGTGTSPSATGPLLDVRAEFQKVLKAFAEHVPPESGTAQDLLASLDADLAALQRLLADAITPSSPAAPPSPIQADTAAAKPGTETAASVSQQADAVNAALRGADAQADALQDLPEWEKIQTVRGAFTHLFRVIKQRAGEHVDRLLEDHRVGDFFRKLSLRTCEKIAQWAQAGAERLRRDGDRPGPQDGSHALPSAEALLRLEKATLSYSSPRGGRGGLPPAAAEVTLPQMRRLGEAPTRPGFSLAAARRRSTTTARRGAKKPSSSAEQAGHLRRSGLEQQQGRKPTQR
ncbi:SNF2-related protein [Streptomyces thermogriseus]